MVTEQDFAAHMTAAKAQKYFGAAVRSFQKVGIALETCRMSLRHSDLHQCRVIDVSGEHPETGETFDWSIIEERWGK
jgi:hypothetical protein